MRVEHIGDATLYLGDCREVLPGLRGIHAVITSPPYDQQRDYGGDVGEWTGLMRAAFGDFSPADACQVLVNLGPIHRDGELLCYWEPWREFMRSKGWRFFAMYVWDKGFGLPGNWNGRLAPAHEYVLHFNKASIQPAKWVRTNDRAPGTGLRRADGSMSGISSPDKCGQPFKIPDSVIRLPPHQIRGGLEAGHPAVFPVDFAAHLTRTFSTAGDVVLDPFMGSGSTGIAAARLGRKFVGIEIHEPYFDIACRRIEEAQRQGDLIRDVLPKAEQKVMDL